MGNAEKNMEQTEEMSLEEIVALTRNFLQLADELYDNGKLSEAEYTELTFLKKNFLVQVEKDNQ